MQKLSKLADPIVIGWLCVLSAALAMSDYSLFVVARHFETPVIFAVLGGVIFDGAAIVFASISFSSVKSGYPGSGAKLGTILCALLSAYINSYHQTLLNQPLIAKLFWCAPPLIAVSVFEAHIRYVKRRALANQGKIAPDLPTFGKWAIILFPIRTVRTARAIVKYRMGLLLARHTPGADRERSPFPVPGSSELSAGSGGFAGGFAELAGGFTELTGGIAEPTPGTIKHAREWAKARGYTVSTRGPLPADVMHEYIKALNTPAIVARDDEITDDTGKETG